jgi:hypothetical protein
MAITNQHTDCEVLNLDPASPKGGPFIVTQNATDPDHPQQREEMFLLRRDGAWVEFATHALMPEGKRVSVLFDSLGDIMKLMEDLPAQPVTIRNEALDQAQLARFLAEVKAGGGMLQLIRSQVAHYKSQRR